MSTTGSLALLLIAASLVALFVAVLRDRRKPAGTSPREGHRRMALCFAAFFAGVALFTADLAVPEVAGIVTGSVTWRGNHRLRLSTADGAREILADAARLASCPVGSQVTKPAWSTAYTCDGTAVGTQQVATWVALAAEVALLAGALAFAARPTPRPSSARGGRLDERGRRR